MPDLLFVHAVFVGSTPAGLAGRFLSIIGLLCHGLAQHAARDWTAAAFVEIMVRALRRRLDRFVALKARFDAGLPPPPPRSPALGERVPSERAFDFVPNERGWLKRTTEHDGAAAFGQLRDLLAEPEMAAFIAADPRVGRLLRPLWWMLSPKLGLPDVLRLAVRPPASSPVATGRDRGPGPASMPDAPPRIRRSTPRVVRMPGSAPPIPA